MLLSINPEHVENILKGSKTYEYRKILCKRKIDKIVIYATYPVKLVVGEVEVIDTLEMEKEQLWKVTKKNSGISKTFFDKYYQGKKSAVAYKLGEVTIYKTPHTLKDIGVKNAPQSYMYLPDKEIVLS